MLDMRASVDVMVVGAGPVGLLLACELRRLGIDYLLVEKNPERVYFCKALGVTPRTLEIFDSLGVVDQAIDAGVWLTGMTTFDNGVETESQDSSSEGLTDLRGALRHGLAHPTRRPSGGAAGAPGQPSASPPSGLPGCWPVFEANAANPWP